MPERMQERIERRISRVHDSLYGLTNQLLELKEKYGVDMWSEVIVYIEKKKDACK